MIAKTDGEDPRLDELLLRWEELREQGQSLSAEELCSTCPELAGELARRIALLRKFDPLLDRHGDWSRRAHPTWPRFDRRVESGVGHGPSRVSRSPLPRRGRHSARSSWPGTPSSIARWR